MHLRLQRYLTRSYISLISSSLFFFRYSPGVVKIDGRGDFGSRRGDIKYIRIISPSVDPFGELLNKNKIRTACLNRMFTTQPDVSENVQKYLNVIDRWDWSPFQLNQLTGNRCLHFTMMKLWQRYNFSQRFSISPSVLMAYADVLEENYQIVSDLEIY